jgi:hypothetical protein
LNGASQSALNRARTHAGRAFNSAAVAGLERIHWLIPRFLVHCTSVTVEAGTLKSPIISDCYSLETGHVSRAAAWGRVSDPSPLFPQSIMKISAFSAFFEDAN